MAFKEGLTLKVAHVLCCPVKLALLSTFYVFESCFRKLAVILGCGLFVCLFGFDVLFCLFVYWYVCLLYCFIGLHTNPDTMHTPFCLL